MNRNYITTFLFFLPLQALGKHTIAARSGALALCLGLAALLPWNLLAQQGSNPAVPAKEADYYQIFTLPIPEGVALEVGGLAPIPDGRLAVSTRRGEVWVISNPYMKDNEAPTYKRFARGLHEPLGLAYKDGEFFLSQRGELTRLRDTNGDGKADRYDKIFSWPLSGNYHEYSYGPLIMPDGNMVVTLNLGWEGKGVSKAKWRGWMLNISPQGNMTPLATGMRSPAGFGVNRAGDIFYAENQGDWVGSGRITHVAPGDFVGNPAGLAWASEPGSPVKLRMADIPDTGQPLYEAAKQVKGLKAPAIWFPQGLMGISTSAILADNTGGAFGPFEDQLFVGDQGQSKIMRVYLEKVKGQYQGALFPFREGFASGILRQVWGPDGSMFVGMTSRGWSSTGKAPYGLQRLVWTGRMPFEMKAIAARPDGFEITFTQALDRNTAADPAAYQITGFTYKYHHTYGSPVIGKEACPIRAVVVARDGLSARLVVDNLRLGYIHEVKAEGLRSAQNNPLLHPVGYYTLNQLPEGKKLKLPKAGSAKTAPLAAQDHSQHHLVASTAPAQPVVPRKKRVTTIPAAWNKEVDYTLNLSTQPGLKFDPARFQVKAGSRIKVVFHNNDDMLHNFVLVLPGTALEVGGEATNLGLDGARLHYIPQSAKVLNHTFLLQPETSETIYFTAPEKPGDYTYVCTVPGHYYLMQGTMKVVAN